MEIVESPQTKAEQKTGTLVCLTILLICIYKVFKNLKDKIRKNKKKMTVFVKFHKICINV